MLCMSRKTKSFRKRRKVLKHTKSGFPYYGVSLPTHSPAEKKRPSMNNKTDESNKNQKKLSAASLIHGPKMVGSAQGGGDDAGMYVGFANLPNQVHRKSVKRGFDFTLMVIGESGLGKSTLVDSLFLTMLYKDRQVPNAIERIKRTVELTKSTVEIEEKGVKLKLTVVDTPGVGDSVDTTKSWMPIVNYINEQYEAYLKDESGLNRRNIKDNRVHCCLYFINAAGHGLKPLDIAIMKDLHDKVNIVPVIAKADTLTKKEVKTMKERILREIQSNEIQIYNFPEADEEDEEDEDFIRVNKELKGSLPFAVVGSNTVYDIDGKKVRGRTYPWGLVDIEDPSHCDFTLLRNMLIRTHMQDMKDVTQDMHYENFRAKKLQSRDADPAQPTLDWRRDVADGRDDLLREKEAELKRMQEMIEKMQVTMVQQQTAQQQVYQQLEEKQQQLREQQQQEQQMKVQQELQQQLREQQQKQQMKEQQQQLQKQLKEQQKQQEEHQGQEQQLKELQRQQELHQQQQQQQMEQQHFKEQHHEVFKQQQKKYSVKEPLPQVAK